jgi:hypothetical protein
MEVTVYNFNFQGLAISCVEARGPLIFKKSGSHLNVLGTRRVTKQVPHPGPKNIRHHHKKFGCP